MVNQSHLAEYEVGLLGELHPLLQQLGTADGLFTLSAASASLELQQVTDQRSLKRFLAAYQGQILLPLELPTIHQACQHAAGNKCREIVSLDQALLKQPLLRHFASASRRVGQSWIKRLRPLRDQRLVQRYLEAVESSRASGWHTIVYGITLSVYSLPIRQGLLNYARETLRGFINAASGPLRLSRHDCSKLLETLCAELPQAIEKMVPSTEWGQSGKTPVRPRRRTHKSEIRSTKSETNPKSKSRKIQNNPASEEPI